MNREPFMVIDPTRLRLFDHIAAAHRSFRRRHTGTDASGVRWAWVEVGGCALGLTWLGPGRVWDATWRSENLDAFARARELMRGAGAKQHRVALEGVVAGLRLGARAGRILFALHRAVLAQKSSLVTVADVWLAETVWGRDRSAHPRHWRTDLCDILRGLTWVHIADLDTDEEEPDFGANTVLITHAGDLRGTDDDACPESCPMKGERHHHFQIDVGPGFLGALEQFGREGDEDGLRTYQFMPRVRRGSRTPSLSAVGKTGRLVSAFVPALLGDPKACRCLDGPGHRLLQALVRETTRPKKRTPNSDPRAEAFSRNRVRSYSGRATVACRLLDADATYVGFNGNGKRRGMGYRLVGNWSWLSKANYPQDSIPAFLDDLGRVAPVLGLTVVGVGRGNRMYSLDELRAMSRLSANLRALARIDVRVFTSPDFVERWSVAFGWEEASDRAQEPSGLAVRVEMLPKGLSVRGLATAIGCDASFLSKMLNGKKPWPPLLLEKVRAFLSGPKPTERHRTGRSRTPFATGRADRGARTGKCAPDSERGPKSARRASSVDRKVRGVEGWWSIF